MAAAQPSPAGTPQASNVPRNPIPDGIPPRDEVTVRFRRWHAFGPTAYMRGQECGMSPPEAEKLQRQGVAVIVHDRRQLGPAGPAMVTK